VRLLGGEGDKQALLRALVIVGVIGVVWAGIGEEGRGHAPRSVRKKNRRRRWEHIILPVAVKQLYLGYMFELLRGVNCMQLKGE
jgi:hypothetical protein